MKHKELEEQNLAEQRILDEAAARRKSRNSPPTSDSAGQRLDQLVQGSANNSVKSTPTKRVSFMTEHKEDNEEEESSHEQDRAQSEERVNRLEQAKEDPNVSCIIFVP